MLKILCLNIYHKIVDKGFIGVSAHKFYMFFKYDD